MLRPNCSLLCQGGQCRNSPGSFKCVCPTGTAFNPDSQQCEDQDECTLLGEQACKVTSFTSGSKPLGVGIWGAGRVAPVSTPPAATAAPAQPTPTSTPRAGSVLTRGAGPAGAHWTRRAAASGRWPASPSARSAAALSAWPGAHPATSAHRRTALVPSAWLRNIPKLSD